MTEDEFDLLGDESFNDISILSNSDEETQSISLDFSNGSPLPSTNFNIVHYNINSILASDRLEELSHVCSVLNVGVLVLTESKLNENIPNNLLKISGYHEPIRRDRTRHGGGVLVYISELFTFKHKTELQSEKLEHI